MSLFFMDAHMHFDLYKDRKLVADYIETNFSYTIAVTNLPVLFERYQHEYEEYKYMKLALGFHPELVYKYQEQLSKFLRLIDSAKYIGEIGLDFSTRDLEDREIQIKIFTAIVRECSQRGNKILSIHSRKAHKEVLATLNGFRGKVILHWYSGTIGELKKALDSGYYFSINHQMLHSNSGKKIVEAIPLNKILIESDAPFTYLLKDEYNLSFISEIYSGLMEIYQMRVEEISAVIKNNFRELLTLT